MQYWRRLSIVLIGFIESLIFSGCLFGWPSLLHVLHQEGVYSHLCIQVDNSTISTTPSPMSTLQSLLNEYPGNFIAFTRGQERDLFNSDGGGIGGSTTSGQPQEDESEEDAMELFQRRRRSSGIRNEEELQSELEVLQGNLEIEGNKGEKTHKKSCKEQTVYMTLIYTVAAVAYGLTSILIGFSLDTLGLWFTRIGGCMMASGGFFCLAFTSKESSWLLWPALNLIALGTSQLRLSSFQFANLWPKYRTTILILYSSAYSVSTTLFLLIQIAYVGHIPYQVIGLSLATLSLLTFPPTFLMPRMKIEVHEEDGEDIQTKQKINQVSEGANDSTEHTDSEDNVPRILKNMRDDGKLMNPFDEATEKKGLSPEVVPLGTSLWTLSAGLHLYWQFITFFLVLFYSATFMPWLQMVTEDDKMIEHYNKMSGLCAIIAPIFIPIAGLVTDWQIRKAKLKEDREERLALAMQAPALTKAIASLFVLGTMICKVFFSPGAIYMSMILIAVSRPFIVGSSASYIQIRFHPSHFNRLNGIFTTIVSILALVQFPIIVWMKQSSTDFVRAQLVLIGMLIVSFISPGHMMIRPLARKYARVQLKFRTDI